MESIMTLLLMLQLIRSIWLASVSEFYQIKMYKIVIISYLFYESLNLSQLALINWGGGGYIPFYSILLYFIMILYCYNVLQLCSFFSSI